MKKKLIKKLVSLLAVTVMAGVLLAGCGSSNNGAAGDVQTEENIPETETKADAEEAPAGIPKAPYFTKGVYANYSEELDDPDKTYFYVFDDDTYGHTEDGANGGTGLPFDTEQTDGSVSFRFGGADEPEEILTITAVEDGFIHAYFEGAEDRPLIFELLKDEDPDTFSGENYVNGPEDSVYHDANGWSIRYDATLFEITPQGPQTFIVYTGESAGTNMITVTYTVENKAEAAVRELGKSWGDKTTYSEGPFPGAGYAKGYWAVLPPEDGGSGIYETAIARDYMDGALIFELTGHKSEDEEKSIEVSDRMAGIIDSLTWDIYDFDTIIDALSEDSYYAYADMDELNDAILITNSDLVFDNGDGKMAATEATVYGYDDTHKIIEYGYVAGGGTATPLACKNHELFCGGRDYMNKVHIDEDSAELITDEGEYFDEYEDAIVIEFKQ